MSMIQTEHDILLQIRDTADRLDLRGVSHHAEAVLAGHDPTGGLVDRQLQIDALRRQVDHARDQ